MAKQIITARLKGITPYGQNRYYQVPWLDKERPDAYEERTWRERCHYNEEGQIFIPPMALKNCLSDAAKYLSIKIPGKGKATYTKHFDASILVMDGPLLPAWKEKVEPHWQLVPANGRDGSKVVKAFPMIPPGWEVEATYYLLDSTITPEVFREHLTEAGSLIGIGWFRPRNKGYWGRFTVEDMKVKVV